VDDDRVARDNTTFSRHFGPETGQIKEERARLAVHASTAGVVAADTRGNGDLPFAKTLFEAADRLRGSVESAEYKHLVLGLLFLKYISDSFIRRREELEAATHDAADEDYFTEDDAERAEILEDRDEYLSENVFWVPEDARWEKLLKAAAQEDIGQRIDDALEEIENDNAEQLRGVLPRIYARSAIEPEKLGALVSTVAKIGFGDDEEEARDVLGRTYEYFIKAFARSEGHRGGEFYTPASVTELLVEMLEPFEGRVLDSASGSGGLFVQSGRFVKAHGGRPAQISILGQELNQATWRICKMNLAIHGLSGDIQLGNSLLDDKFKGKRADFVLANPPFNLKKWGADQVTDDVRWEYGTPPDANANYAWIQHFVHHLTPNGRAGFVLANGSLTSNTNGEGKIREAIVRDDVVDCIVALPAQLFFTTQIPVCLWFLDRDKASSGERDRRGEMLFVDARKMGQKISRTQIELTGDEIQRIARAYHAWRGQEGAEPYVDIRGFCKAVSIDEVESAEFSLVPSRYVGAEENGAADKAELKARLGELSQTLLADFEKSDLLAARVAEVLAAARDA
jgi:type I restriction enzyme M protein